MTCKLTNHYAADRKAEPHVSSPRGRRDGSEYGHTLWRPVPGFNALDRLLPRKACQCDDAALHRRRPRAAGPAGLGRGGLATVCAAGDYPRLHELKGARAG
jgi:hypothetical protein